MGLEKLGIETIGWEMGLGKIWVGKCEFITPTPYSGPSHLYGYELNYGDVSAYDRLKLSNMVKKLVFYVARTGPRLSLHFWKVSRRTGNKYIYCVWP